MRIKVRPGLNSIRTLFHGGRNSLFTWISSLGIGLFTQADRLIVGAVLGTTAVGVYSAISSTANQISSLSAMTVQPLLPALGKLMLERATNQPALERHVKRAQEINLLVALGIAAALFTLALPLMQFVIPVASASTFVQAFQLAVVIYTLLSINAVGYYILLGTGAVDIYLPTQFLATLSALLAIALGAHFFGLLGAISGNALGILLNLGIPIGLKKVGIPLQHWASWVWFPLVWFMAVIMIGVVLPESPSLRLLAFLLEDLVLLAWFLMLGNLGNSAAVLRILAWFHPVGERNG